jgi:serine/threonine-protein kinase PknK
VQGDLPAARNRVAEARDHLKLVDDPTTRGLIDCADGLAYMLTGQISRARDYLEQALAATDDIGMQGLSMLMMAWVYERLGDADQALGWFEKVLALTESHGESVYRSYALTAAGAARWRRGETRRAQQLLHDGLRLSQLVNDPVTCAQCLEALAWIAGSTHHPRRAAVLMAAADALGRTLGAPCLLHHDRGWGFHDQCERRARQELGTAEFDTAWNEGNSLTFDEAVEAVIGQ